MITTDPIADMLTRLRNAAMVNKTEVSMPYSKLKARIAEILKKNGYIAGMRKEEGTVQGTLVLNINADTTEKAFTALVRVSKPGRRIYAKRDEIPRVLGGRGIVIVSTPAGVMTGYEARAKGLGGELICKVW
jgi:small subunit ribosomal protein S8